MSAEPLTCPYCNAQQPLQPGLTVGRKLTCVRCGEVFTLSALPAIEPTSAMPEPPLPTARPKPIRANLRVAVGVLSVMLLMAGVGLTYALLTVQTRRDHDKALPRKSRRPWQTDRALPPDEVIAPYALAGLRYLPSATGVVAAVQVEELLAGEPGKELRSRSFRIANGDFQLDNVKDWIGLGLDEIEHVVLGIVVRDGDEADLTPPTQLIVRTRRAYDAKRVQLALKAGKPREERAGDGTKRTLYTANVRNVPATLWLADELTIVLGLFGQFELVPGKPHEGLSALGGSLREVIEKRVSVGSAVWIAGHADDWKKTWLPTLAATLPEVPLVNRLGDVKTFALWLIPTKPVKILAAFRCNDEATAQQIEQAELLPRAADDNLKFSREGAWLDVQITWPQ